MCGAAEAAAVTEAKWEEGRHLIFWVLWEFCHVGERKEREKKKVSPNQNDFVVVVSVGEPKKKAENNMLV